MNWESRHQAGTFALHDNYHPPPYDSWGSEIWAGEGRYPTLDLWILWWKSADWATDLVDKNEVKRASFLVAKFGSTEAGKFSMSLQLKWIYRKQSMVLQNADTSNLNKQLISYSSEAKNYFRMLHDTTMKWKSIPSASYEPNQNISLRSWQGHLNNDSSQTRCSQ